MIGRPKLENRAGIIKNETSFLRCRIKYFFIFYCLYLCNDIGNLNQYNLNELYEKNRRYPTYIYMGRVCVRD